MKQNNTDVRDSLPIVNDRVSLSPELIRNLVGVGEQ